MKNSTFFSFIIQLKNKRNNILGHISPSKNKSANKKYKKEYYWQVKILQVLLTFQYHRYTKYIVIIYIKFIVIFTGKCYCVIFMLKFKKVIFVRKYYSIIFIWKCYLFFFLGTFVLLYFGIKIAFTYQYNLIIMIASAYKNI